MKKKILVTLEGYAGFCKEGRQMLLDAGCELYEKPEYRVYSDKEMEELVVDVDGIILGLETLDKKIVDRANKLKVVARFGVGVDNIDLAYAKSKGIYVTNCFGINSSAVAEHTILLMLASLRDLPEATRQVKTGHWVWPPRPELKGKTIGFLGCGSIPRKIMKKLSGFETHFLAYDVAQNQEALALGAQYCELDYLLANSDIISVHLPLLPETYHFVNSTLLERARDGVVVVNTGRGDLIDEEAMIAALKSGKVAFFGADVLSVEPADPSLPILNAPNVLITPHISAETVENYSESGVVTAQAILDVFAGKCPKNLVNA